LENGIIVSHKDMDHMYGKMGINIKGNFEKVSNMVKVMIIIRMEIFI